MARTPKPILPARPRPPADLRRFTPALGVKEWIASELLAEEGRLHNAEHRHLIDADFEILWAPQGFITKMRRVIGQAEEVTFRASAWQKGRQEQQMIEWFGGVPGFLITLDAEYCATCTDVDWCALVEHELYHLGHQKDGFGAPIFTREGLPKLAIRGHDVEEFIGVVRRYGIGDPDGALGQLAAAARTAPEVSIARVAGACGTCLLRAA